MTTPASNHRIEDRLADLKTEIMTLKDEIRVNLHLAGMDLRDEWRDLERRLPDPTTVAADLKEITAEVVESFTTELKSLRDRLRARRSEPPF